MRSVRTTAGTPPSSVKHSLSSRSVVFEYRDSWSLFTMLALHQPLSSDFDRAADPDPQTLVFIVNDGKFSGAVPQSGGDTSPQAKVFVRIKLRPPGKPDNLRMRGFPTKAPPLETVQVQAQSDAGGDNQ